MTKLFTKFSGTGNILSDKECDELAKRITTLTEQLRDVRANFDIVTDERAIDALIYEENAILCRIEALHHEAKERGITVQLYQR